MKRYPTTNPLEEFYRNVTITNIKLNHLEYRNVEGKNLFERVKGYQDLIGQFRKQKIMILQQWMKYVIILQLKKLMHQKKMYLEQNT